MGSAGFSEFLGKFREDIRLPANNFAGYFSLPLSGIIPH
jgi:hypothetical protein